MAEDHPTLEALKQTLSARLQTAIQVELSTIPPYLSAWFSIHPGTNAEAASVIRSVFMEEMLHMLLAGNVLSAVGGRVALGPAQVPVYPLRLEFDGTGDHDRNFTIELGAFSAKTVRTFMRIELPDTFAPLEPTGHGASDVAIPGYSLGDFYEGIRALLTEGCERFGEAAMFSGDPANQLGESAYGGGGGKPVIVTDLASASRAIKVIVEQGEGAAGSMDDGDDRYFGQEREIAHFFRFKQIEAGRLYSESDRPKDAPSGAPLSVDYGAVYPIKPHARSVDYAPGSRLAELNDRCNRCYTLTLKKLEAAFNGEASSMDAAIDDGMEGLKAAALEMVAMPIPGDPEGRHGAPTFEWVAADET